MEMFVEKHELQLSHFKEEMKKAFVSPFNGDFIYSLSSNIFSWKRKLRSGIVAKLGQIHVEQVPVPETYESILEKALEKLSFVHEKAVRLENENSQLKEDRDLALSKVTELATMKEEWEKKLYGQFVAVLNAKKERIQLLQERLDFEVAGRIEKGDKGTPEKTSEDDDDAYDASTDEDSDVEADDVAGDIVAPEQEQDAACAAPSSSSASLRRCRDAFSFDSSPGSPASPLPVLPKRARIAQRDSSMAPRRVLKETVESQSEENLAKELDDDDMEPLTLQEDTQDLIGNM